MQRATKSASVPGSSKWSCKLKVILFWEREGWNGSGVIRDQFRWLPPGNHEQKRTRSSLGMDQVGGTWRSEPRLVIQGLIGDMTREALGYAAGPGLAGQNARMLECYQ